MQLGKRAEQFARMLVDNLSSIEEIDDILHCDVSEIPEDEREDQVERMESDLEDLVERVAKDILQFVKIGQSPITKKVYIGILSEDEVWLKKKELDITS